MGDTVVSALVNEMVRRLTSAAIQEYNLFRGFKGDILSLKEDFIKIQAVLEDAEAKHIREKAVEVWLHSLRSTSLRVENVLDEVSTVALLQRLQKEIDIERGIKRGIKYKVRALYSKVMFRVRAAHQVKAIRTKLDVIASRRFELNLTPSAAITHAVDVGVEGEMPTRETSSLIHDSSIIFGRNEQMETLTRMICNKDLGKYENGEIRVFGICGMGGMGKTTLAQLVYNHHKVAQYFDLKCWVYVSENFQVKEIIKGIITSLDKSECTLTRLDVLQDALQSKLRGHKFLVVLDDVWAEENEKAKWDELKGTLSCGEEGSIVVMTTRSERTCRMMAKVPELQYDLGCLLYEDSWLLFKKLAFAMGRVGDDIDELEPIGKEIVEKCGGLPLAVKTLGSLMWSKRSTRDWQQVKGNITWNLQENVLSVLKLSYDNLLPHLKRCFAYCSLFPKGYEMTKDEVIQLWVANGFIPPREEIDLYVLGEEILDCLVWRSFFQVVRGKEYAGIMNRYIMHDLMHDMARHVMRDDCLVKEPTCNEAKIPNEVLHFSSSCMDEKYIFSSEDLEKLTPLRSIFMFKKMHEGSIIHVLNHVYLRLLYLFRIELTTLPDSICKLKHLRYLNLSHSSIEVLPESIMYLQNLQVLILSWCRNLCKLHESVCKIKNLKYLNLSGTGIEVLPEGVKDMINLQRLYIDQCFSLQHLPFGIEKLTSLRVLSRFLVGKERGAKIGELGNLKLLEGVMWIEGLENVVSLSEARSAKLKCKRNLSGLLLKWLDDTMRENTPEMFAYVEEVLEGLEPNPSLNTLAMFYYMGKTISPSWIENLRNLVYIKFDGCYNCEHIPPLGWFPNLKVIHLREMNSLKCFHDDDINVSGDTTDMFPCLQELNLFNCQILVSLPSKFPKLKALRLYGCDLVSLPDEIQSFTDMNELVISYCKHLLERCEKEIGVDWFKISHIPNIRMDPTRSEKRARTGREKGRREGEQGENQRQNLLESITPPLSPLQVEAAAALLRSLRQNWKP